MTVAPPTAATTRSAAVTFTITVNAVNDAPVADDDSVLGQRGQLYAERPRSRACSPAIRMSTRAIRSSAVLVAGPSDGSLTLNADGSFTYTPAAELQRHRLVHLQGRRRHADIATWRR